MSFAQYILNTHVIFGAGSISALAGIVKESTDGGLVAIITDDETGGSQLDSLQQVLPTPVADSKEFPRQIFKVLSDSLTIASMTKLAAELNELGVRGLLAIGGDGAMYLAKGVAAMMATPGIANLNNANQRGSTKVFCIPTSPGTGSELVSEVILNEVAEPTAPQVYRGAGLAPDWTFYDSKLIANTPGNLLLEKAAAGLCQAIEAFVAVGSNEVTEALASNAAKSLGLMQIRPEGGHDQDLLSKATNGTMLAALARQNAAYGAAQGLALWFAADGQNQQKGKYGKYAALAAALLPLVMRYNMPESHEKYAMLAGIWGLGGRGDSVDQAAQAIRHIMNFNRRVGIPSQLRAFGFAKEALGEAVAHAQRAGLLEGNPRPVNNGTLTAVLEEGW